jgi:hypothetical protein
MGIACRWCAFSLDDALAGRVHVASVIAGLKAQREMEEARDEVKRKAADDHYQATGRVKFG